MTGGVVSSIQKAAPVSKKSEVLVISAAVLETYLVDAGSLAIADTVPSEELVKRVAAVNGKATAFTTTAEKIFSVAQDAEEELYCAGLSKRDRVGAVVRHRGAGPAASSYRSKAKVTEVVMQRRSAGWVLVGICEDHVFPKAREIRDITLTPAQADAVARVALKPFKVAAPTPEQVAA